MDGRRSAEVDLYKDAVRIERRFSFLVLTFTAHAPVVYVL